MSEEVQLRYRVPPKLLLAAMVASVSTARPTRKAKLLGLARCAMFGAGIGAVALVLKARFGDAAGAGFLLGSGAMLVVWQLTWYWRARRIAAEHEEIAARAGEIEAHFGPEGLRHRTELGETFSRWGSVSAVLPIPGGTALRQGTVTMPVPDEALPEGLTPEDFRARLEAWRAA